MSSYNVVKTQVFVVGKDFGGRPAYLFALLYPERVSGVVTLGVPYTAPSTQSNYGESLPEGFYINRWQVRIHLVTDVIYLTCTPP